jgi:hypothetical protein
MLNSPLTNGDQIKPDNPRIPAVIRDLHPTGIEVSDISVNIYRNGKPEEYFLTRLESQTNTWILCVAGKSYWFDGGREILRIQHN